MTGGLLISGSQLTGHSIRGLASLAKAVVPRPSSPYPKGRCNSTQSSQFNHTRGRQNPVTLIDFEGTEQVEGTVS